MKRGNAGSRSRQSRGSRPPVSPTIRSVSAHLADSARYSPISRRAGAARSSFMTIERRRAERRQLRHQPGDVLHRRQGHLRREAVIMLAWRVKPAGIAVELSLRNDRMTIAVKGRSRRNGALVRGCHRRDGPPRASSGSRSRCSSTTRTLTNGRRHVAPYPRPVAARSPGRTGCRDLSATSLISS